MSERWRWWGFGGSVLLAVSATLAGAVPSGDPGDGFRTGFFAAVPARFSIGLIWWLAGAILLSLAWLRSPTSSVRQTLLTGVLWAAPLVLTPPLGSRDLYAYACQGWIWWHGGDPYSTGVLDGGCPWAQSVPSLWWHTPTPYGPLAVSLSGFAAATGSQLAALIAFRLLALLAAALLAWQLPRLATLCTPSTFLPLPAPPRSDASALDGEATATLAVPVTPLAAPSASAVDDAFAWEATSARPRGAGHASTVALRLGLVTPLVLVHGLSGGHNDLLVAALVVTALAIAARSRPPLAVVAGVLLAGAVGIKATALVAVPFVIILTGRRWWQATLGAAAGYAALSLLTGLGLGWIPALRNTGELAQWSSPPTAVGMAVGYLTRSNAPIAVARVMGLVALAAIAVVLVIRAWQGRHSVGEVTVACGALLAATVLLGPVFYPWYAIVPIAVLATVRRRLLAPAIIACTFLVLPNGLGLPVLTKALGAFAVTAALIALLVSALRKRRPAPVA